LCDTCEEKLQNEPAICPACKTKVQGDETVALLLTRATASKEEKALAQTALVHVCPKCHVLYFDNMQYKLLEKLKQS
jgi:uncharacterized protein with PIN domain